MATRALHFTALGPLEPNSRAFLGVEIRGSGLAARPVVMVFLPRGVAKDEAKLNEIRVRTESAMRLIHPNIIQVLGLEHLDDGWARIVEYANGESLGRLLSESAAKKGRPPAAVAAAILADACLGVHQAHEAGDARDPTRPFLHGGLRPATLMLTHQGKTKVTGYGAAIFAPSGADSLHPYLAPEQVMGGVDAMTRQTDVYGLGALLYELIAGGPPFLAEDGALDQQILNSRPSALRVAEQAELGEIAQHALSKRAAERYPTALAMREALLSCKSASPASAEVVARWLDGVMPPSHPERVARKSLLDSAINTTGAVTLPADVGQISGPGPIPSVIVSSPPPPPVSVAPSVAASTLAKKPVVRAISESEIKEYVPSFSEKVEIQQSSRRTGVLVGILGGMVIGGAAFAYWRDHQPEEPLVLPPVAAAIDAGAPAPKLAVMATDGGAPIEAAVPVGIDAGAAVTGPIVVDAGPRLLVLEISTEPPMDIRVDGKAVGRETANVSLPEGPHHVEASDRAVRAYAARDVELHANHQKESLTVGSSQLALDVPAGAAITIDGKPYGTAPVEPATLYQGTHEVLVNYNGAETTQTVHMHSDVNLTLTVHAN